MHRCIEVRDKHPQGWQAAGPNPGGQWGGQASVKVDAYAYIGFRIRITPKGVEDANFTGLEAEDHD